MQKKKGISLIGLIALVISSAIGAGIYQGSGQIAQVSTAGPALVAWAIVGIGIFGLAMSLTGLGELHPELTGISDYARAGFGNFAGFLSGWGYWLSAWVGNAAFATMLMSAVGYFIPSFKSGNSVPAVIVVSIISWLLTLLVINGVESAAFINSIVTIVKIIPIVAFIILGVVLFKANVFTFHFWSNFTTNFTYHKATFSGVFTQIKSCIIFMMWIFIGIEGASMMADRARKRSDAKKATIIGFISLLIINVVVTILPFGYLTQEQLAKVPNPSLTYVIEKMIGSWGGALVSISIIITILGAWLSWTMLPVEATSQMAEQKLLPKWFGEMNKKNSPAHSLLFTQVLLQLFLITLAFSSQAYNFATSVCAAAIVVCYALVGAYAMKVGKEEHSWKMMAFGFLALIFEVVGIIFAGLQDLWLITIFYVLGFVFYIKAAHENGRKITKVEWLLMALISIAAVTSIIALACGKISIS